MSDLTERLEKLERVMIHVKDSHNAALVRESIDKIKELEEENNELLEVQDSFNEFGC